jgi:hypothetical protein
VRENKYFFYFYFSGKKDLGLFTDITNEFEILPVDNRRPPNKIEKYNFSNGM